MRVLHVVRQFHPAVGGLENMVLALARAQLRAGLQAEVLTLNRRFQDLDTVLPSRDCVEDIPVRRIPFRGSRRYPLAPQVLSHLEDFDLVHVHGVDFFADFLSATAPWHKKPMVLTTHGGFFHTTFAQHLKRFYFKTITKSSLRNYRRVIACSDNDAQTFRTIAGERVVAIENGVDIQKFRDVSSREYQPKIAYFGRFAAHKGILNLINAFDRVRHAIPDARLVLIGNDSDGMLRIIEAACADGLRDGSIKILTDRNDGEIADELSTCSFFASASQYEGFGLTLVEAMSAGLIPIANEIPSFEAILRRAGVGLPTNFDEPEVAADNLLRFMRTSSERYTELRSAAIAAAAPYDWAQVEQLYRNEYERVVGHKTRTLLGVEISVMSRNDAVDALDQAVAQNFQQRIAFANAHTLRLAARNPDLRKALRRFLVLNDGFGVDIASRMKFGRRFPANLNGTDFVPHYLTNTRHKLRIFLLGARPEIVRSTAARFAALYPRHSIVGARDGYLSQETDIQLVRHEIKTSKADILLVAMGNPLQEIWIDKHCHDLPVPLQLGVGALFDFASGRMRRAPGWIRRARCEWLYRLALEPRRLFSRYVVGNIVFLHLATRDRRTGFAP
ncbi:WecB/TagA/CpsF family glycosyltransferase [Hyphomicrobium sp. MC1]|uniref:WecB/TagA/CpsF family glycosyltransferase n=1 Tax=Hyphomicrobium sp. (strain MC1) TaxID=717785 RepID=UPI000213D349|nr:WecB/TagA/CpsF family glycosyltransferase [Hyphomicrobium sp. MC1]CCB64990.1 Glycosyl transferase, WecB/TagA/CpsF family [Hyphomicrobium sp. MC1]